jgi:hypothetical protein
VDREDGLEGLKPERRGALAAGGEAEELGLLLFREGLEDFPEAEDVLVVAVVS